jgi:CBS domain-containing protein
MRRAFRSGVTESFLGLVTRVQIESTLSSGTANASTGSILTGDGEGVHADHPLEPVMNRLAKNPGLLPVVNRDKADLPKGLITSETVIRFVQKELNTPKGGSANPEV